DLASFRDATSSRTRHYASPALRDEIKKPSDSSLGKFSYKTRVPRARHRKSASKRNLMPSPWDSGFFFSRLPTVETVGYLMPSRGRDWCLVARLPNAGRPLPTNLA